MITTPTISHRQDEQDIRKIFADLVDVWNRHDMNAWSPLFTADADFVNIGGAHLKGRGKS